MTKLQENQTLIISYKNINLEYGWRTGIINRKVKKIYFVCLLDTKKSNGMYSEFSNVKDMFSFVDLLVKAFNVENGQYDYCINEKKVAKQ